jgi:hypothetical protein
MKAYGEVMSVCFVYETAEQILIKFGAGGV